MSGSQKNRLSEGGRIDRSRPIEFRFNGRRFEGFAGDTLASALLANGVRLLARSFKYHRPRGVLAAGIEEPNALFSVDCGSGMVPATRATLTPRVEGLRADTQNCFPSQRFDVMRILDWTHWLWPAGFYNKTFIWPSWHVWEDLIRKVAGIGRVPEAGDAVRFRNANRHCDELVVGGGEAGIRAAIAAAEKGHDVVLVEQDAELGGRLLSRVLTDDQELESLRTRLSGFDNVQVMLCATAAGYYDHNVVTVHDRSVAWRSDNAVETFWTIRAGHVTLATGAIEQPLMFGKNDLPGIMLTSAIRDYATRYGVACGRSLVVITNNDLAYDDVIAIANAGISSITVVDTRAASSEAASSARKRDGVQVISGATPVTAGGGRSVSRLIYVDSLGRKQTLRCDLIGMSGGLNPTVHLYSQAGGKLQYDEEQRCFRPLECNQNLSVVGRANGEFSETPIPVAERVPAPYSSNRQWVDFHHDVTVADIELAVRENFVSVEHMKRYTAAGMAIDQGKTSNLNALSLLGRLSGREPGSVGTTTFRPQFMPVTVGAIAGSRSGELYAPTRYLPAHKVHESSGAIFDDYGGWLRPAWYGDADRESAIQAEVRKVRDEVGLLDASPLGKFEIYGPDASEFLDRIYVNTMSTLKPGKVRYGIMLHENGVVFDDGVVARIDEDRFLVNSTSANAAIVGSWFEEWLQCEWPDLEVVVVPVTSQWGVLTLAGQYARDVLGSLAGMADLATDTFPHMSFTAGTLADGTPYRLQRVSYSGEMSFELSVPAKQTARIANTLLQNGRQFGIGLFGVEALDHLRIEKGFLHVGADTDVVTNPVDIGFGSIVAKKKSDFVGARSLQRPCDRDPSRRQLVGFEMEHRDAGVLAGSHFYVQGTLRRSEGFVTSAANSEKLGRTIGLGLLERGFERIGETLHVYNEGYEAKVTITAPGHYDKSGERMNA